MGVEAMEETHRVARALWRIVMIGPDELPLLRVERLRASVVIHPARTGLVLERVWHLSLTQAAHLANALVDALVAPELAEHDPDADVAPG